MRLEQCAVTRATQPLTPQLEWIEYGSGVREQSETSRSGTRGEVSSDVDVFTKQSMKKGMRRTVNSDPSTASPESFIASDGECVSSAWLNFNHALRLKFCARGRSCGPMRLSWVGPFWRHERLNG